MNNLHVLLTFSYVVLMLALKVSANGATKYSRTYRSNLLNMISMIDEDTPPCDDFFQHTCGSYEEWHMEEDALQPFLYNMQDRRNFFEEHKFEFGSKVGRLLGELHESCQSRNQQDVFHATPMPQWPRMLKEIDFLAEHATAYAEWPFVHHQWDSLQVQHNLSWITLSSQLAAHGLPTLLNVFFAERAVFVAPLNLAHCPSTTIIGEQLMSFMDGKRNEQIAAIVANELWNFCRELIGELPLSGEIYYVIDNADPQIIDNDLTYEYFNEFFHYLNFSAAEVAAAQKIPMHEQELLRVFTVMRTTDPRIIFNYVMWQAYVQLRYEDCYELTVEFEQLLFTEYWQWHALEQYLSRNVAMAQFIFHTTRFQKQRKDLLLSEQWFQYLVNPPQRRDLNLERLILAYGKEHLNDDSLAAKYEHVKMGSGFYGQLLSMRRIKLQQSFYNPLIDDEEADDSRSNSGAYFMRKFLHFTILLIKQPLYHYFATEGFDLWHRTNLHSSTDGFYTALDCLEQQDSLLMQSKEEEVESVGRLNEQQVREIYRFYNAFIESQRDYEFWLQAESFAFAEDFVLEYFKLNAERILFYAVAQLHCGRNDMNYRTLINRTYMNMPAFATAFNCTAASHDVPMNPTLKCMLNRVQ